MTTEEWIFGVVSSFYDKAKIDVLIGYHFRNIPDFDTHIPRIATFWDFQLTGKSFRKVDRPYNMMGTHFPLGIKPGELGRWLLLFRKTLEEQVAIHPEMHQLATLWDERLKGLEAIFKRNLVVKNP